MRGTFGRQTMSCAVWRGGSATVVVLQNAAASSPREIAVFKTSMSTESRKRVSRKTNSVFAIFGLTKSNVRTTTRGERARDGRHPEQTRRTPHTHTQDTFIPTHIQQTRITSNTNIKLGVEHRSDRAQQR